EPGVAGLSPVEAGTAHGDHGVPPADAEACVRHSNHFLTTGRLRSSGRLSALEETPGSEHGPDHKGQDGGRCDRSAESPRFGIHRRYDGQHGTVYRRGPTAHGRDAATSDERFREAGRSSHGGRRVSGPSASGHVVRDARIWFYERTTRGAEGHSETEAGWRRRHAGSGARWHPFVLPLSGVAAIQPAYGDSDRRCPSPWLARTDAARRLCVW